MSYFYQTRNADTIISYSYFYDDNLSECKYPTQPIHEMLPLPPPPPPPPPFPKYTHRGHGHVLSCYQNTARLWK